MTVEELMRGYDPATMARFRTVRVDDGRGGSRYHILDRATGALLGEPRARAGQWGDHVLFLAAPDDSAWDAPMIGRGSARWATTRAYMEHRVARDLGPEFVPARRAVAA